MRNLETQHNKIENKPLIPNSKYSRGKQIYQYESIFSYGLDTCTWILALMSLHSQVTLAMLIKKINLKL